MTEHNTNPNNLNLESLRTTPQILRHSVTTISASLPSLLLLSLLLFSFRSAVDSGTSLLTSFLDRDPSLRLLLSRLDLASPRRRPPSPSSPAAAFRRPRPFLHLTRVGTLDDDFFSGDGADDRSLLGPNSPSGTNFTDVLVSDFGLDLVFSCFRNVNFRSEVIPADVSDAEEEVKGFVVKGFDLGRKDAAMLFFLVSFLSAAYGWVILGFLVTYSWISGIVFLSVVNAMLTRFGSLAGNLWNGSRVGLKRLSGFILMRWAVRDAFTQLLGLYYFGEIEDQYSFFKLFVRLKLMPFSIMSPWIGGYEEEISGFLIAWYLVDFVVGLVFAVDAWIAIVDARKTGKEIVKEGFRMISVMFVQAVQIKGLESFLCGSIVRWGLGRVFGRVFAKLFQSGVEVFFMVVWLMFYFGARCKEASFIGRRFGRREIEGLVDGLR